MRPLEHIGIRIVYLQNVQTATKIESYPLGIAGIDITSHATLANRGVGKTPILDLDLRSRSWIYI